MLKILQLSPWEGGCGYTPQQISEMTPDQIYFCLCEKKVLRRGAKRTTKYTGIEMAAYANADKDGFIKGRDAKGRPMKAKIKGESVVQRIMREEAEAKAKAEEAEKGKKKRRRRRRRNGS